MGVRRSRDLQVHVEELLRRMGGVATRRDLLRLAARRDVDAALRHGSILRDAHGRYSLAGATRHAGPPVE